MYATSQKLMSGRMALMGGLRHLTSGNVASLNCIRGCSSSSFVYRPIYTTIERQKFQTVQQCRHLANITSGTYAPSSMSAKSQKHDYNSESVDGGNVANVFQDSDHLPSLPVPQLSNTLELLKETIWPIAMNSGEFANALHLIEAFAGSAGQKLDLLLRTKAKQTKNWLTHDWWLEKAYLESRAPLVVNSNPGMIYPKFPFEVNSQEKLVATTANLISGIIDYKLALHQGYNPEATDSSQSRRLDSSLCYDQYSRIFGSTRLPGDPMDTLRVLPEPIDDQRFDLVCAYRGQFFEISLSEIQDEMGRVEALKNVISKLIESRSDERSVTGVGILTTARRDVWSKSIKLIDPEALEAIQNAHLIVSIDTIPTQPQDAFLKPIFESCAGGQQFIEALSRQVLHGDRVNVGNRWFDKSLQLIVVADESCQRFFGAGVNYEHSNAEAVVVTKLIEYSFDRTIKRMQSQGQVANSQAATDAHITAFKQLRMDNQADGEELKRLILGAKQDFVSQIDQFDLAYFDYAEYGRNAIKSWHLPPDSWFQVALQMAHYQLHKRLGPCYESASTRRFAYGRTETIRSLTKDVAQFCFEPNYENMLMAIQSHKTYAQAANNAAAIDRVLMGYRLVFNELKANQWSWGVPTFESKNSTLSNQSNDDTPLIKFDSLANAQHQQRVDINDLFTEDELNTLSAFFNNELFERSKKFTLSTSQVSSLVHPEICMSYGPIVADGYGCCYNLSDRRIVAAITANSSNQSFSCRTDKFSESLRETLNKMRDIVESHQQNRHEQQQCS